MTMSVLMLQVSTTDSVETYDKIIYRGYVVRRHTEWEIGFVHISCDYALLYTVISICKVGALLSYSPWFQYFLW